MNRMNSSSSPPARMYLGLLAAAVLVPPAWAYVNGGDYHSTLHDYEHKLIDDGWAVYVSVELPGKDADVERLANRMVGRILRTLPEEQVDRIPLADKREVARIAREMLRDISQGKNAGNKSGQIGSLKYQVGTYTYSTWWETNYDKRGPRIHEKRPHQAIFVALKIVTDK